MEAREYVQSGRVTRVTVTRGPVGWEVKEERDSEVVRQTKYTDWHRVERAMLVYDPATATDPYSTNR